MNWIMIKFEDGSNPYICKTQAKFDRIKKKYPNIRKISDNVYRVDDKTIKQTYGADIDEMEVIR